MRLQYKERYIGAKNTRPGERHTQRATDTPQYEDRKRTDIKMLKLRTMTKYYFIIIIIIIIWFVRLLELRPLLAYCASLGR
jgi:hypothetical protein